jgi:hypothetical protein
VIDVRVKVTAAVGALIIVAALVYTLSQSPITVARASTPQVQPLAEARRQTTICQAGETIPRQTSAIRLRAYAFTGPRVTVRASAHGRAIVSGERSSGWTGGVVTVPVDRLPTSVSGVTLCFTLYLDGYETMGFAGELTSPARAARVAREALAGRVRVEYLRPNSSSWWSLVPQVARRLGLGHAPSGTWSALLALALMGAVLAISVRLVLRGLG